MNNLKTVILLGTLTGLLITIGYYFGGENGALMALLFSAFMNFGSYWFSDKIVLSMYKAKEADKNEHSLIHSIVEELSKEAQILKPRIYIVPMDVPNAFATGRNQNNAVVAVTKGIMNLLNDNELKGVIAHEIGHIKNKDILISSISATLAGAISYLINIFMFRGNNEQNRSPFAGLLILFLTPLIATLLNFAISRNREYLADKTGAKISKDPNSLAEALKKLQMFSKTNPVIGSPRQEATAHMFIINPFKTSLITSLFSTHPPVEERVRRLLNE